MKKERTINRKSSTKMQNSRQACGGEICSGNNILHVSTSPLNPYLRFKNGVAVVSNVEQPECRTMAHGDGDVQQGVDTAHGSPRSSDERSCVVVPHANNPYYRKCRNEEHIHHTPKKRSRDVAAAEGNIAAAQRYAARNAPGRTPQCFSGKLFRTPTSIQMNATQGQMRKNAVVDEIYSTLQEDTTEPSAWRNLSFSGKDDGGITSMDLDKNGLQCQPNEELELTSNDQAASSAEVLLYPELQNSLQSTEIMPSSAVIQQSPPTTCDTASTPTASSFRNLHASADDNISLELQQEIREAYAEACAILNSNGWANIPAEAQINLSEAAEARYNDNSSPCSSPSNSTEISAVEVRRPDANATTSCAGRIGAGGSILPAEALSHDMEAVNVAEALSPNESLRRQFNNATLNEVGLGVDMDEAAMQVEWEENSHNITRASNESPTILATDLEPDRGALHTQDETPRRPKRSHVETRIEWDPLQLRAIQLVEQGHNVFLTGVAGTGKSEVTKEIVTRAYRKFKIGEIAVGAPSGTAAVNLSCRSEVNNMKNGSRSDDIPINATTIHKIAGISVPRMVKQFGTMWSTHETDSHSAGTNGPSPSSSRERLRKLKLLVIDEVSMIQAEFLDWLDVSIREVRGRKSEAFGGIQLVFIGDFAQLGPVPGRHAFLKKFNPLDPIHKGADLPLDIEECSAMAFQSAAWREAHFQCIKLERIFRQQHDRDFSQALMDIRVGHTNTPKVHNLVEQCQRPLQDHIRIPENITPTRLFSRNQDVDEENLFCLGRLSGTVVHFEASDDVRAERDDYRDPSLSKEEARNQLGVNDFFGGGARLPKHLYLKINAQVVLLINDPRELNDENESDDRNVLVNGSRGVVVGYEASNKIFPGFKESDLFPVVRFMNGKERRIEPCEFTQDVYRVGTCVRLQVPLKLAWAMTIHKSQGSTLDLVEVDLKQCFADGQAYVALSRARNANCLLLRNYTPNAVKVNRLVLKFYETLRKLQNTPSSATAVPEGNDASSSEDKVKEEYTCKVPIKNNKDVPMMMEKFLAEQAGLWWYPIALKYNKWLPLFRNAHGNGKASKQFRLWQKRYSPLPGYNGWCGYSKK